MMKPAASTVTLPVAALRPGAFQPRRTFDDPALQALAASIRAEGILQPLLVRPVNGGHEIVAGERRWRAAQLAGLTEVPVLVRDLDDRQALAASLLENLQREDLNVIDEVDGKLALVALALGVDAEAARGRLMQLLTAEPTEDHVRLTEVFSSLGETWESFAKNKVRILNWPPEVVDALRGGLPLSVAAVVAGADERLRTQLLALAQQGASRAELRAEVQRQALAAPDRSKLTAAATVVRRLSSRRFMTRLSAEQSKEMERWLAKMPSFMRDEGDD
nr:ParB/RepB/Spo0J family partition protein [Deinococcus humi]